MSSPTPCSRRGHSVHVVHMGWNEQITCLGDLPWISFEDGIEHIFPGAQRTPMASYRADPRQTRARAGVSPARLAGRLTCRRPTSSPPTTISSRCVMGCRSSSCRATGHTLPRSRTSCSGRPVRRSASPRWLVDVGTAEGRSGGRARVRSQWAQAREVSPRLADREASAACLHAPTDSHPQKGPAEGLAALAEVRKRVPEVEATVFSTVPPAHETAPVDDGRDGSAAGVHRERDLQPQPHLPVREPLRGLRVPLHRGDGMRRGAGHDLQRRIGRLRDPRRDRPRLRARRRDRDGRQRRAPAAGRRAAHPARQAGHGVRASRRSTGTPAPRSSRRS